MSVANAIPRKRFTREEVDQMDQAGLFPGQRLELIDGDLIDKMGQNPPHASVIQLLQEILTALFGSRRVRIQFPIELRRPDRKWSLPEPDIAVPREAKPDFDTRHPNGDELLLVIEVADSSVALDLTTKRDLYARAEVCEYWVVDIQKRCVFVHRKPARGKYASTSAFYETDAISIESAGASILVAEIFPKKI